MKPILAELGLVTLGREEAWAVVSPDDRYRYLLGRSWDQLTSPSIWVFGMLNPSRARIKNDMTVSKCIGFAKRGGATGVVLVNAMAFSSPYPDEVVEVSERRDDDGVRVDVYGAENDVAIDWTRSLPHVSKRVAAWGKIPEPLEGLADRGTNAFLNFGSISCLGINADGSPKHPSRLPYSSPIVPFRRAP